MDRCYAGYIAKAFRNDLQSYVLLLIHKLFDLFFVLFGQNSFPPRRRFVDDPSLVPVNFYPPVERRLTDIEDGKRVLDGKFPIEDGMNSRGTNFWSFSFHAMDYNYIRKKLKAFFSTFNKNALETGSGAMQARQTRLPL